MAGNQSLRDRRWRRVPLDIRVKVAITENEQEVIIHGRSNQISEGGMGLTLTQEVSEGTIARLIFKLPGEDVERSLAAELKHRHGFHCGFEFLALSAPQRNDLRSFCIHAIQHSV